MCTVTLVELFGRDPDRGHDLAVEALHGGGDRRP